jgi:hypothetical protein
MGRLACPQRRVRLADVSLEARLMPHDGTDVCAQLTVADCGRITQLDLDVRDQPKTR